MSISLPGSARLSLKPALWEMPNGSRAKSEPRISFMGRLPISWSSSSQVSSVANPSPETPTNKPASPAEFAVMVSKGRWHMTPHLELLNQALVYLSQRKAPVSFLRMLGYNVAGGPDDLVPFNRLVVEMPPRHGKSELVSRYFPAWYIGQFPEHRVILGSYGADFARSWGRKARDLLKEHGPSLFGVAVKRTTEAGDDWEVEGTDGGMITAGVGGPITGRGANALLIDDAVKNAEEAASETIQKRNADWWDSTAYTRIEPDGIACVTATRWHAKDLTGHILEQSDDEDGDPDLEPETWYTIKLSALAEPGDTLGRAPGEALWPERYPVGRLERIKRRIGSYFFGALYQQRPSAEEGDVFKRSDWKFYDELPGESIAGYSFIDTAGYDDKSNGDYAVIATVVRIGKDLYWKDVQRGRWTFPELVQRCRDARDEHKLPIMIEDVPWAKPLIQTLQKEISGVVPFKIEGHSKETRAHAVSPFHESGNFYLPRRAKWVADFIEEHAAFPKGSHDDQVDTTSMAGMRLLLGRLMPSSASVQTRAPAARTPLVSGSRRV